MKSLAELQEIRNRMLGNVTLRKEGSDEVRVVVGMATCGIAAGSKATMICFMEQVDLNGLDAVVTQTGCMGFCEDEPTVEITKPGEQPVLFKKVDCAKVKDIVQTYLLNH